MYNSQEVKFLNYRLIDLESIKRKIQGSAKLDSNAKNDIMGEIDKIIGPQEAEWIQRNEEKDIADYVFFRYKFKFYPKIRKVAAFPLHLLIEPVSFCNIRCVMCFQNDPYFREKKNRGMIDLVFFKDLIDQASENNCGALTLASRGEPMLHPRFDQMLDYCKDKFFELKINVNASKLSESLCYKILDSHVDIVVFSVDTGEKEEYQKIRRNGNFDTVVKNIRRFCKIRNSKKYYSKTSTRISGVYLGYQDKQKFYEFWKEIVDAVAFVDAAKRWDTYMNDPINNCPSCNTLWEKLYVWFDGICNPCDMDYKSYLSVGNAKNISLKDIWLGEKYSLLRKQHAEENRKFLIPCDRCNLY